jgi:hypothetical protein
MLVAVTGSTGLLGSALVDGLQRAGDDVVRLVRPSSRPTEGATVTWDPEAGTIDAAKLEGVSAVVHLAGEGIADGRWTPEQKRRLVESRRRSTTLLAETLAGLRDKPSVLLSASGMDYYGDRGDEVLTETSAKGAGFLPDLCEVWEQSTQPAADAGIRAVQLRTTMVLDAKGGALAKLLPLFRFGVGGRMGSGRQWWSWISIDDWVGAAQFLLRSGVGGPVNMGAPEPVTNAEFTKALGGVLRRPTLVPVPSFGPKLLVGRELADVLLFTSKRVAPKALLDAGFEFRHPDVTSAFRAVLSR